MSDSGVSASYVDSAINNAVRQLRAELHDEIRRLENEMRELAVEMVNAIRDQTRTLSGDLDRQTVAVVAGVAASTAMLERTRRQIEQDFELTRERLQLQTEADIQMEIGKKIADAASAKTKLAAFKQDIESRFAKSMEGIWQNRMLYTHNFGTIFDEHTSKLKTIGEHIFRIKEEDLEPAKRSLAVSPEALHGLPMEVDMYRLRVRAESLDGTLSLLESNRLGDVLEATERLERFLSDGYGVKPQAGVEEAAAVGLAVRSALGADLIVGASALPVGGDGGVSLSPAKGGFEVFSGEGARKRAFKAMEGAKVRGASGEEIARLAQAAGRLMGKGLLSQEALVMFEDFLGQQVLQVAE